MLGNQNLDQIKGIRLSKPDLVYFAILSTYQLARTATSPLLFFLPMYVVRKLVSSLETGIQNLMLLEILGSALILIILLILDVNNSRIYEIIETIKINQRNFQTTLILKPASFLFVNFLFITGISIAGIALLNISILSTVLLGAGFYIFLWYRYRNDPTDLKSLRKYLEYLLPCGILIAVVTLAISVLSAKFTTVFSSFFTFLAVRFLLTFLKNAGNAFLTLQVEMSKTFLSGKIVQSKAPTDNTVLQDTVTQLIHDEKYNFLEKQILVAYNFFQASFDYDGEEKFFLLRVFPIHQKNYLADEVNALHLQKTLVTINVIKDFEVTQNKHFIFLKLQLISNINEEPVKKLEMISFSIKSSSCLLEQLPANSIDNSILAYDFHGICNTLKVFFPSEPESASIDVFLELHDKHFVFLKNSYFFWFNGAVANNNCVSIMGKPFCLDNYLSRYEPIGVGLKSRDELLALVKKFDSSFNFDQAHFLRASIVTELEKVIEAYKHRNFSQCLTKLRNASEMYTEIQTDTFSDTADL